MPRTEARIFTSIWKDEAFRALPPSAQRLYMFLLSQDDLTYCGVMPLREKRWAAMAAGLTASDIEQDLKALATAERLFVIPDWDSGELLVRSLMRRDGVWKQPNLLKLAREAADQVESRKIRGAMLHELRRLPLDETPSAQVKTLVADFISDLEQGTAYPTAYPPGNPADSPPDDPTEKDHAYARGTGDGNGPSVRDPEPLFPGAPTDLPAQPVRDRKLGTRLPEPFIVTDDMKSWFAENCPHVKARVEHERFLDHWRGKPGKDGRKIDWVATWRNWMRTAEDRAMPRQRSPGRQQETDDLFDEAAARIQARKEISQ